MSWTVLKFGGSSLSSPEKVAKAAALINEHPGEVAVVVSAQGDTTDRLERALALAKGGDRLGADAVLDGLLGGPAGCTSLIEELRDLLLGVSLLREVSAASRDLVLSHGERLSILVMSEALRARGREAIAVDARNWLRTDTRFGDARVDLAATEAALAIERKRWRGAIPVITGFIGASADGRTTTLGRGGSDYSATLLARGLQAKEVQIWTDVPGVMTADPAIVDEAKSLKHMSYGEALELAVFGARVLHPRTLVPLLSTGIPMRIKNSLDPSDPGTLVDAGGCLDEDQATSVTSLEDQALFDLRIQRLHEGPELGERVHRALAMAQCHPWLITHSAHGQGISVVLPRRESGRLRAELENCFEMELARGDLAPIEVREPVALLTVVGEAMGRTPGVNGRLFGALGAVGINVLSIGQSATARSVSCVVDQAELALAVETVHGAFHFSSQRLSIFLLGTGTVGGALLDELDRQQGDLAKAHDLKPVLVGVATSSRLAFSPAATAQASSGIPDPILDALARQPVPVLVDCTAAEGMESLYEAALTRGIHVVVANKKALTTPSATRDQLLETARRSHRAFCYETTVGAALPVIHTVHDLLRTGDSVHRIEGSLSGSLGVICEQLNRGLPIDEAVQQAMERGYTEPRPQEDLSGTDAARKALILARELGLRLDLCDVEITPLVPEELLGIKEPDEFITALKENRGLFAQRTVKLRERNQVLRYLAVIDPSATPALRVGPVPVGADHPAASLAGSQAFVAFSTRRYAEHPLIVQGAGAGGEVTASGVLGEVLRIAKGLSGSYHRPLTRPQYLAAQLTSTPNRRAERIGPSGWLFERSDSGTGEPLSELGTGHGCASANDDENGTLGLDDLRMRVVDCA